MFLKRLDVVGFKSFAEKVSIDFVPGVTAVVGPNGSGKSNISDSIRWVLGEQSAKSLRGAKMEDIIFAGSDSRKALNFAEVTLILDNENEHLAIDYSEVSVTRRVYRSGDSEYLINNQRCRLKDIVDLFLDSGLGKEAYSIIGQGKVEEILNSKAEERRVIFEEAAGVLKYKTRKVTAEKRLQETQENLYRVEDILHELEDQVEPMQIQASIAKDYLHKRDELKEIDIALQVYEINQLHHTWTNEKEELTKVKKQIDVYQNKLEEMEKQRLLLREKTTCLSTKYNETQDELLHTSEELEKNDGKRKVLMERKKNATQNKEQIENSLTEKTEQVKRLTNEWKIEQEKLTEERNQLNKLESIVAKKKDLIGRSEVDSIEEIERMKADYIEVLNEQASIRNERRYLEEQRRQLEIRQNRLLTENKDLLNNRQELIEQLEQKREKVVTLQQTLEQCGSEYRELLKKQETSTMQYRKKEKTLYESYQITQRMQSRADVLAEMQADFSGFFHGVKAVLKARRKLSGVHGAVAELIQVPKEYEIALEIAFGGASQHIVMETERDARAAIHFLKTEGIGRATFLPLPVMKPRTIPDYQLQQLDGHHSFIGVAANLLSFDQKYERVMHYLLGNVIISTDLQGANELAKMTAHRIRIVTLEGDVVNPGGSMTGGSVKQKQTPLLGRKRELQELQEKLFKLNNVTKELEQEVKKIKGRIENENKELGLMRSHIEKLRADIQEKHTVVRDLSREVELTQDQFTRFDREKSGFIEEVDRIQSRLAELATAYEVTIGQSIHLEKEVKRLEQERLEQLHSREALREEMVTDQIALATAKERYLAVQEQFKRVTQTKTQLEEEQTELEYHYHLFVDEMSSRVNGESSLEESIHASRLRKDELSALLSHMKQERVTLDQSYANLEIELKKQQVNHLLVADECREIEVKVNRMDVELDNRLNHLRDEYELSFEAAHTKYELAVDPDDARTKVNLIKLGIEELGSVNIGAIDEYDRIKERFDFLNEQRSDLMEAKTTLHDVIAEMDQEMTKRFYETYRYIRTHFQKVFKQLFGGGEADLVLTDPDNLLETGVEIVARPPGKKMQQLGLLSGGERALTAIGLLFAILYVRPVPFCVLDEVEAALDEANVSRFAHFLKEFSAATQFIVITHRKGTMEEADVLYGVTMQESGVSNLVSVKLEETSDLVEQV